MQDIAKRFKMKPAALHALVERSRSRLYEARARRAPPLRDDKILAAWNGLMISAFARAGLAFADPDYVRAAERAATFVVSRMRTEGRLHRVFLGDRAEGPAFAEDYAFLIAGLLDLYEAAPDPRWLREVIALQAVLDRHYADEASGSYFRTANDHEKLIARERPGQDGAIPSANSVAALNLLRLSAFTSDDTYHDRASQIFSAFYTTLDKSPVALSEMLLAVDFELDTSKEVFLVRPAADSDATPMLDAMRTTYLPNRVFAIVAQGAELDANAVLIPLLQGKKARNGEVTAYVCENRMCRFPTSDPAEFVEQLRNVKRIE